MEHDTEAAKGLPETVRDHLGQQLRSTYKAGEPQPDYLGDPVTPVAFEGQVRRLEARITAGREGEAAVAGALGDLLAPSTRAD